MQSLIVITSLFLSTPTQISNLSTVQELENDIRASVRETTLVLRNRTKIQIKNIFQLESNVALKAVDSKSNPVIEVVAE